MKILSKMIIEALRETYPVGTRVVLQRMDDPQAPQLELRDLSTGWMILETFLYNGTMVAL